MLWSEAPDVSTPNARASGIYRERNFFAIRGNSVGRAWSAELWDLWGAQRSRRLVDIAGCRTGAPFSTGAVPFSTGAALPFSTGAAVLFSSGSGELFSTGASL